MKILLTGAGGFLGWHTRVRLTTSGHTVVPVTRGNWDQLAALVVDVDAVVHLAGVNRGPDVRVEGDNIQLARDLATALSCARQAPRVVFANSIHAGTDSPYGRGKAQASTVLESAAAIFGLQYVDVRFPNLFGEHGRPRYNSVVHTFVDAVITGQQPQVDDRPISLLHAQSAAQTLTEVLGRDDVSRVDPKGTSTSVQDVLSTLQSFHALYTSGDIPPLTTDLDVDLFNTFRAALFPAHYPIWMSPRADHRGSLVEVVRSHGGPGQTFVSTTHPGVTRGEHFHLRKVERFVVLGGSARISLRRLFDDTVVSFDVDGDRPAIVDMPTLWAHNITNTGAGELTTLFWTHGLFDPDHPDTYPEAVGAPTLIATGS